MTIKDQNHYNPEEPKPEYIELKNCKYQIFNDHVRFVLPDGKEVPIPNYSLKQLVENVNFNQENGYYTGQCISCHKFDALIKGYCKPCADKEGIET